ncbi:hypothetical protein BaRGS_00018438 [Batillaria attramentaria]|uniref:Transmembrane protein n=1 Tax=Batillaria attramentaria TaxID=370345 RepID=A0ABD0KST5_9CAEN
MLKRSLTIDWGGRKALILFVWTLCLHSHAASKFQPDSKRGDSVTAVTENNVAASLRTGSSRVSDFPAVYVVTVTNNVSGDPVPFLFGVDFMVVASVGIVALAITISIACMRRELPRPCLWPALSEDYLHPSVSHVVMEGTDDAAKATPLYENSTLRQVDTAGLGGETARSFARGTNSTDSSLVVSSDTVAACSLEPSRHDDDENEEER